MKRRIANILNQEVELTDITITLCPADIKALEDICGIQLHNDAEDDVEDCYDDDELEKNIAHAIISLIRNYPGSNLESDTKEFECVKEPASNEEAKGILDKYGYLGTNETRKDAAEIFAEKNITEYEHVNTLYYKSNIYHVYSYKHDNKVKYIAITTLNFGDDWINVSHIFVTNPDDSAIFAAEYINKI